MTIICSIILFTTWCFSFLNAICISKVPGHYINRTIQASTARTAVEISYYNILHKLVKYISYWKPIFNGFLKIIGAQLTYNLLFRFSVQKDIKGNEFHHHTHKFLTFNMPIAQ